MGVHGLWQLLAPAGRRVPNELVRHKVLAVDASIWLTQLVKALRDAQGARVRNAHLVGVLRRCVKLLFLAVRPLLVFDGATPHIKRRTVAARRALRERHHAKLRRLAETILLNRIKSHAVAAAISAKSAAPAAQPAAATNAAATNAPATYAAASQPVALAQHEQHTQPLNPDAQPPRAQPENFAAPHVAGGHHSTDPRAAAPADADAVAAGHHFHHSTEHDIEPVSLPNDLHHLDDDALLALPPHMQSKVFKQIKQQQRLRHRENMMRQQHNPTQFSKTQIDGFLRNTALNRKISNVRNVINHNSGVTNRIASDSRREFVFEELKAPHDHSFDMNSDCEDDILSASFRRQKSHGGPNDVLSQIRATNAHSLKASTLRAANVDAKSNSQSQMSSGVGWASRVLSGSGALQLARITGGSAAHTPATHSASEEEEQQPHDDVQCLNHHAIDSPSDGVQKQMRPPHAPGHDSDSDDVEWEDGALKSDTESSGQSFEVHAHFVANLSKPNNVSGQNRFLPEAHGTQATGANQVHHAQRGRSPPLSNHDQNATRMNCRTSPQMQHEAEKVSETCMDANFASDDNENGVVGNVDGSNLAPKKIPDTILCSPTMSTTEKETLLQKQSNFSAEHPDHVNPKQIMDVEHGESATTSPSTCQYTGTHKKNTLLESEKKKTQTPSFNCSSVHVEVNDTKAEQSGTQRRSRSTDEEESDIQLALALSVKESIADVDKPPANDKLSHSAVGMVSDGGLIQHPQKVGLEANGRQKAVRDIGEQTSQDSEQLQFNISSKSADAHGFATSETTSTAERGGDGQQADGEMSLMEMERMYAELDSEAQQFKKQRDVHVGAVETISEEMYAETRDLLKLLGIPYLEAPMEAEAQCAFLNTEKLVDGVITEDSDAFLFGAKVVYRQLFADGKFAEAYDTEDIKSSLGLDRDHLIRLAHLLGSDYTPGVRGVGIVNAMEIMEAFPGENGLSEFLEWTKKVTVLDKEPEESVMKGTSADAVRRRFCWKHRNMKRNWVVREGFPNPAVSEAYMKPTVDTNRDRFKWGEIDFEGLARFCWEKFGWEQATFDNAIGPLRKELLKRKGPQQTRISEFFKPHRFAKIRSKRLQQAVKGMTGDEADEIMATLVPRIKRRKTTSVSFTSSIELSAEEEEQMLKLLEETEANRDAKRRNNSR